MKRLIQFIVTFGWVGLLPKAPGTWGSLAALPVGYAAHWAGGFPALIAATGVACVVGWLATKAYLRHADNGDPSEVVIDEVAGQLIALWPLSFGLTHAGVAPHVFPWPGWVGAFVLFRLFDIVKIGPVGWADRRGGALGVMLDDVIAGVFAAIVVTVAAGVSHGWFM